MAPVRLNYRCACAAAQGGLTAGALAFSDALPELSAAVLGNASKGIQAAFASYAPSGAWTEGLGYWGYGTNYAVVYIDSMLTATGGDGGAAASPGLNETGLFCLHGVGPSWDQFNWGDSGSGGCDEAVRTSRTLAASSSAIFYVLDERTRGLLLFLLFLQIN